MKYLGGSGLKSYLPHPGQFGNALGRCGIPKWVGVQVTAVDQPLRGVDSGMNIASGVHLALHYATGVEDEVPEVIMTVDCRCCP